ncbi:MAG: hypothetical protein U0521_04820 [Anaerolineae bacterium]
MTSAYDTSIPPARWRLALLVLALTVFGGAALALILALGAANPPHAADLVLNQHSDDGLTDAGTFGGATLLAFPVELAPPFTVEMEASNSGAAGSAWGVWLRVSDHYGNLSVLPMLVDTQGYALAAVDSPALQHHPFIHIQRDSNRVYLHVDQNGTAVYRINDEIFATVALPVTTIEAAGLALYGSPVLDWRSIKIYSGS